MRQSSEPLADHYVYDLDLRGHFLKIQTMDQGQGYQQMACSLKWSRRIFPKPVEMTIQTSQVQLMFGVILSKLGFGQST